MSRSALVVVVERFERRDASSRDSGSTFEMSVALARADSFDDKVKEADTFSASNDSVGCINASVLIVVPGATISGKPPVTISVMTTR